MQDLSHICRAEELYCCLKMPALPLVLDMFIIVVPPHGLFLGAWALFFDIVRRVDHSGAHSWTPPWSNLSPWALNSKLVNLFQENLKILIKNESAFEKTLNFSI
jgi:hypothetical protein